MVKYDVIAGTGEVLIPVGSEVRGHLTELSEDPPRLGLSFDRIEVRGEDHDLNAELIAVTPREHSEMTDEGAKIGGGAAAGAAAGTGVALATKDKHVYLPVGSVFRIRLVDPFEVLLPEPGPSEDEQGS